VKNLKLAIFAYNHPESTLPLVKHLAKRGHAVDYYFVTYCRATGSSAFSFGRKVWLPGIRGGNKKFMKPYYDYMESSRVNIFLVVLPPYGLRYFYFMSRLLFSFMGLFLKSCKYDFINVVGQNPPLLDLLKALGTGHNIYTSLHEVTPRYAAGANHKLVEYLTSKGMNIITHCNASRNRLLHRVNGVPDRIHVVPFGVFETYSLFDGSNCEITLEKPYILNYGTILPYKGLDVLYEAAQLLGPRLDGMKIVVAGCGADPYLKRMIKDPRFVVINRYLSNEEIVALNKGAYCIVCPYKSASQSGIVSTTYLFGKPIIASDVGGFNEYITDGENGLLIPPNDPKALAESLSRLMTDALLYDRLRKGALAFSSSAIYSWDAIVDQYVNIFSGTHGLEQQIQGSEHDQRS
jgi:glycosyltransferase involved in cell wall biosynthesis